MGGTQSAHEAMARGPKKHLKRLNAPKHWMLDKMGGVWAPRPSTGPHKLRECLPLILILRNRLKYALTKKEVQQILMQRLIKVDGKVRTDPKGRYVIHRLNHKNFPTENQFKLCRIAKVSVGAKNVPYVSTHDGRTVRYPDPNAKMHDVIKVNIASGKAEDLIKFEVGATCVNTRGQNQGRVGVITNREKHIGSFEIVHVKDSKGRAFATRINNVFCIAAKDDDMMISIPRGKGLRDNILEERKKRLGY